MGLIDDKKSIIKQISVFNSMGQKVNVAEENNTLPSINNKNEPIPFMLDTLTVMVGSQALERVTGQVMTDFVRGVEPQLKTSLIKQNTTFNSNQTLSAGFAAGYTVPVSDIDLYGKLKTDPSTQTGELLYGDNVNDFDKGVYNAINAPGTDVDVNNVTLNYNETTDEITITPQNSTQSIGDFISEYVDGLTLINEKAFTTRIVDLIFGTASKQQNKPLTNVVLEQKISKLIKKISDNDTDLEFTKDELALIEKESVEKVEGVKKVDVGCSIIDSDVSIDDLENLVILNSGSTDPVKVGQNFGTLIDNSFGKNPTQTNPANKNAIRDGFFKRIIDAIQSSLIEAVTITPQIRVLLIITKGLKNGDVIGLTNPLDDIKNQKNLVKCLADSAKVSLNEFIFNLLKAELIKLLVPVTKIILQEKLKAFINIIKSLI